MVPGGVVWWWVVERVPGGPAVVGETVVAGLFGLLGAVVVPVLGCLAEIQPVSNWSRTKAMLFRLRLIRVLGLVPPLLQV